MLQITEEAAAADTARGRDSLGSGVEDRSKKKKKVKLVFPIPELQRRPLRPPIVESEAVVVGPKNSPIISNRAPPPYKRAVSAEFFRSLDLRRDEIRRETNLCLEGIIARAEAEAEEERPVVLRASSSSSLSTEQEEEEEEEKGGADYQRGFQLPSPFVVEEGDQGEIERKRRSLDLGQQVLYNIRTWGDLYVCKTESVFSLRRVHQGAATAVARLHLFP